MDSLFVGTDSCYSLTLSNKLQHLCEKHGSPSVKHFSESLSVSKIWAEQSSVLFKSKLTIILQT